MHGSSSPGTILLAMGALPRVAWALALAAVLWLAVWWAL
jgi:hypothetical protein